MTSEHKNPSPMDIQPKETIVNEPTKKEAKIAKTETLRRGRENSSNFVEKQQALQQEKEQAILEATEMEMKMEIANQEAELADLEKSIDQFDVGSDEYADMQIRIDEMKDTLRANQEPTSQPAITTKETPIEILNDAEVTLIPKQKATPPIPEAAKNQRAEVLATFDFNAALDSGDTTNILANLDLIPEESLPEVFDRMIDMGDRADREEMLKVMEALPIKQGNKKTLDTNLKNSRIYMAFSEALMKKVPESNSWKNLKAEVLATSDYDLNAEITASKSKKSPEERAAMYQDLKKKRILLESQRMQKEARQQRLQKTDAPETIKVDPAYMAEAEHIQKQRERNTFDKATDALYNVGAKRVDTLMKQADATPVATPKKATKPKKPGFWARLFGRKEAKTAAALAAAIALQAGGEKAPTPDMSPEPTPVVHTMDVEDPQINTETVSIPNTVITPNTPPVRTEAVSFGTQNTTMDGMTIRGTAPEAPTPEPSARGAERPLIDNAALVDTSGYDNINRADFTLPSMQGSEQVVEQQMDDVMELDESDIIFEDESPREQRSLSSSEDITCVIGRLYLVAKSKSR